MGEGAKAAARCAEQGSRSVSVVGNCLSLHAASVQGRRDSTLWSGPGRPRRNDPGGMTCDTGYMKIREAACNILTSAPNLGSGGDCLGCLSITCRSCLRTMESVQQEQTSSSPQWVLRNTFIEVLDDASDSDAFSSGVMRAHSDSVLYVGYSRRHAAELEREDNDEKASQESPNSSGESMESELDSWSDAETSPDFTEGERSLPLPCYHHIEDSPSGRNSPRAGQDVQHVARTPSPRCQGWAKLLEAISE